MRLAGYVVCMGETTNAYNIFIGKPVREETTLKT
jgi:hypothetical protein